MRGRGRLSAGLKGASSKAAQEESKHVSRSNLLTPRVYAGKNKASWVRHDFIYEIDFFKDCDPLFLDRIAEGLDTRLYLPNEVIIEEGTEGTSMSILHRGTVQVSASGRKMAELRDGSYFGEIAVLGIYSHRTASVTATTICDVRTLPRVHFLRALKEFPGEQDRFNEIATQRAAMTVGAKLQQTLHEEKRRLQERRNIAMERARMLGGLKVSVYQTSDHDQDDEDSDADSVDMRIKRLSLDSPKKSRQSVAVSPRKSKIEKSFSAKSEQDENVVKPEGGRVSFPGEQEEASSPRKKSLVGSKWRLKETVQKATELTRKSLSVATRPHLEKFKALPAREALDWLATKPGVAQAPRHHHFMKTIQSLQRELWRKATSMQRPPWHADSSNQKLKGFDSVGTIDGEPSTASLAMADWDVEVTRLRQQALEREEEGLTGVFGVNHATAILREVTEQEARKKSRGSMRRTFGSTRCRTSAFCEEKVTGEVREATEQEEQVAKKKLFHGSYAVSGGPLQQLIG